MPDAKEHGVSCMADGLSHDQAVELAQVTRDKLAEFQAAGTSPHSSWRVSWGEITLHPDDPSLEIGPLLSSADPDTCAAIGGPLAEAIDYVNDQGRQAWLTVDGVRVAEIIPAGGA